MPRPTARWPATCWPGPGDEPVKHLPQQPGRHRPPPPGRRRRVPEPGRRKAVEPGPQHRGAVRPRYGRIAVALSSAAVTAVAVLGSFGMLLPDGDPQLAVANAGIETGTDADTASDEPRDAPRDRTRDVVDRGRLSERAETGAPTGTATREQEEKAESEDSEETETTDAPLPAGSGEGRRVVFSESQQRVWLVEDDGTVARTYLASGSVYDNLDPGTYEVFSTSRYAVGIDDSGTMEYFVRFTHGDEGAAIGFHTIPVDDGVPVQTREQLGTPLSHGCIRQAEADAIALWEFAPVGTTVVVTP